MFELTNPVRDAFHRAAEARIGARGRDTSTAEWLAENAMAIRRAHTI